MEFSPNDDAGNKKSGRPGANGRSVLKTVIADKEPNIFNWLLLSSIETVMPSLRGAEGLHGKQSTANSGERYGSIGSTDCESGVEELLANVSLEMTVSDCANPPFASNTSQVVIIPKKWYSFRASTETPNTKASGRFHLMVSSHLYFGL